MQLSRKTVRLSLRQQDAFVGWLLVAPSLMIILGVTLQPVLTTLYLSLFEAPSGINLPKVFVGLANYASLLKDNIFWTTLGRTIYFMVNSVALELILGMAIA